MNRLAGEASPYLRQHADNPVDWYPWGDEAFAEARRRDRPILLSVGYSSCHWCHVMAHESFEDPDTATVMNALFVNVKVDREERPDVDAIYMEAVQAQTGRGGWPMTAFLTPEGEPFFGGTYFPKERRQGVPSFLDLCAAIDDAWVNRRADVVAQAGQITEAIRESAVATRHASTTAGGVAVDGPALPRREMLGEAVGQLVAAHDDQWGGFGRAPKFPQAMAVDFLLRWAVTTGSAGAGRVAIASLDAMAAGGVYDHLGGGFARYSTDEQWLLPHFEKMLYDNALLTRAYLHAWQATGEARFRQVLEETITYVLRDLRGPEGGFFSAEDADSEGEEGKFYLWTYDEVLAAGGHEAVEWYEVTAEGNFTPEHAALGGEAGPDGRNILNRRHHRGDLARSPELEAARRRLFDWRETRVRPGLDDKCLTEWNALFLSALAEAAAATGRADWLDAAIANGEFLLRELRQVDGRWLRSWQAGAGARHLAYAADHAALIDAFVRLAEASGQSRWIDAARSTADALLARFRDVDGSLFTTGDDAEQLIARTKELTDNATPSAASNAAIGLWRLAALTGEAAYRDAAIALVAPLTPYAVQHPLAFGQCLGALELLTAPPTEIVLPGDRPDLRAVVFGAWRPHAVVAWGERYASPLWEGRDDGRAYVCYDATCELPASDVATLEAQLRDSRRG